MLTKLHEIKYVEDLIDAYAGYIGQALLNLYAGTVDNINDGPVIDLFKAKIPDKGFFGKLREYGRRKLSLVRRRLLNSPFKPFIVRGLNLFKKGGTVSKSDWDKFEKQSADYLTKYTTNLPEEFSVKSFMLGMASIESELQNVAVQDYGAKSYSEIENTKFGQYIPDSYKCLKERFAITQTGLKIIKDAEDRIGEYIQDIHPEFLASVKKNVLKAQKEGLEPRQLASNLYWQPEDDPEMAGHSADAKARDWHRVAYTEMARLHEETKLAMLENQAELSINDPEKAVYLIFHGTGRCEWCSPRQGTLVRLLPRGSVKDETDDSLKAQGISDPHTETATWIGKTNYGRTKAQWYLCTPAHPWCGCVFTVIDPATHEFDEKLGRIVPKKTKQSAIIERVIPASFLSAKDTEISKNRRREDLKEKDRSQGIHKRDADYIDGWRDYQNGKITLEELYAKVT